MNEDIPENERPSSQTISPGWDVVRPTGRRRGYRSLFWPIVLIGVGVLWLMSNVGLIGSENLSVLVRLWPLIFIVVGLDILVGRDSPVLGALIGLAAVALIVALVLVGPSMGLAGDANFFGLPVPVGDMEMKHGSFVEPVGSAESATVNLDLGWEQAEVYALDRSTSLIDAELDYTGEIRFDVSGERAKTVNLAQRESGQIGLGWISTIGQNPLWSIGLNPDVPMDLHIDVASGSASLDLAELNITALEIEGGSGSAQVGLPATGAGYRAVIDAGSGSFQVDVPQDTQVAMEVSGGSGSFGIDIGSGAAVDISSDVASGSFTVRIGPDADVRLEAEGGSGSLTIDVPGDAAVRVVVERGGSGSVNVRGGFDLVDDGGDNDRDTGVWETSGFQAAAHTIVITIADLGSGSVSINR